MYILGIAPYHNSSACILKDGQLIAAVQEERFKRVKNYSDFPFNSINYVLKAAGITLDQVDYVAFPNDNNFRIPKMMLNYFGRGVFLLDEWWKWPWRLISHMQTSYIDKLGLSGLNSMGHEFKKNQVFYIKHHLAHASAGFRNSGFDNAIILTMDGWGDWWSSALWTAEDNSINLVKPIHSVNSLGFMYSALTEFLGYDFHGGHEQKVMGLAAYGQPTVDFSKVIKTDGPFYRVNGKYVYGKNYKKNIKRKFGTPLKNPFDPVDDYYKNLAASLQKSLEISVLNLLQYMVDKYESRNLVVGGGVGLNCKMNGELLHSGKIKNIFINPSANDTGNCIGAAMEAWAKLGNKSKFEMAHAYWGPEYSNDGIERTLKDVGVKYETYGDISGIVAELIAKGKVVCWFQGRMEWGPRALGNRSIIGDPTDPEMVKKVNIIKGREYWRPLAPSLIDKYMGEYFENPASSPFMLLAFKALDGKKKEIPSVIHADGTSRPQTVDKGINPKYYKLIEEFEKIKGVPVILNTSFNKGEPINCSPLDALKTFFSTPLDAMAIGDFLIKK